MTLRFTASALILTGALICVIVSGSASAASTSSSVTQFGSAGSTTVPAPGDTFPDVTSPELTLPNIIPGIDSGAAPATSTDRGGSAQLAVLGLIIVGLAMIGLLMWRESRQKRRQI